MRTFKDAEGREWKLSITVPGIERVLKATGLNIVNPLAPRVGVPQREQPDILTLLLNDVGVFFKVLGALLARQMEKEAIKPEDFAESLDAKALGAAWNAFREEWNDFFRSRSQPEMVTLLDQQAKAQATEAGATVKYADEAATVALAVMENELEKAKEKALRKADDKETPTTTEKPTETPSTASASATSGPESAASPPAA